MFRYKAFISYALPDKKFAEKLFDDLCNAGVDLWFSKEELVPGQNWHAEIERAIQDSSVFLALISSNTLKKNGFTQTDFVDALKQLDTANSELYVILVRLDEFLIDANLQQYYWVDMFPSYSDGFQHLLNVLNPDRHVKMRKWDRK